MRSYLRAENEGLVVGSIQIDVLEVRAGSVKLGINDPNASPSYREEVLYVRSDDDDDDNETDAVYEPYQFKSVTPFAVPFR